MSNNQNLVVISELQSAINELDHNRVSWVDKHFVMDLRDKASVLLEAVSRLEEQEKEVAIIAAQEFLTEVAPVIQELNNQKIGSKNMEITSRCKGIVSVLPNADITLLKQGESK
ncbi:MAG: hypothetical protein A2W82_05450 [Sulfurimonas sp. RIFCSPLOWO2_12_36_12]|uniref:hypothetical protein n=1 Tax=Sulfurimonas sp. RIFCSPLOWO2_12_36_12 TaxID=1802253 RepID=UPI0008AE0234|nr:hypothetical protein [Sulfurimonas sp. RIFCSPLOWO2_12_36_12]OHD99628.1 MAG: hypothetical protein A3J26_07890 [Sulfurimonas sp. RIFCSPLOWO2_02_FULL_36_28]OHE01375.1 MAG: hypothetical protein A2W82_05450 [Sulfurimonas sp. RIFCSPLOWO2_12_36_12]